MQKVELKEIKSGQTGTGLLIENDGFVSLKEGQGKQLYESIISEREGGDKFFVPNPFIVPAVFQKYGLENANGRIYPEAILKREVEKYQIKIQERRAYGELNHPSDSTIDLGRLSLNIVELHWENATLVGKLEILVSEGYRRSGIISCMGDMAAHLLLSGLKIGVSSRGVGSVETKFNKYVVGHDFELVCWDMVGDPSTKNAWIGKTPEELNMYIENNINPNNTLLENLKKFDNIF